MYEECNFLKPNWQETSIFETSKYSIIRLYIILSKTFDETLSKDTGL